MRSILQVKLNTRSIFFKLLVSFLAIILLFVSFNIISLVLYRNNIHDEIIKYNDANLTYTTNGFEQYFQLLNSVLVNMYLSDNLEKLNRSSIDYVAAGQVMNDLQHTTANSQLYLNNLFIYDAKLSLVLEKIRGSSSPEIMFSEHYSNPSYSYGFWNREFAEPFNNKFYPAATFTESQGDISGSQTGLVIPYMVKSPVYPDFIMLAFIDANKLYRAYHQSINDNFYMISPQGETLFSSDMTGKHELPALEPGKDWVKYRGNYYFYKKGAISGLTYVNIVPDGRISAQLVRLNVTLLVLLVISVLVSVMVSVFSSMRFNNPVKKIVESIRHLNEKKELSGGPVNEFELISENIGRMMQLNRDTLTDLEEKKSLLRYYSLMNRLKRIRNGFQETHNPELERKYRFVLFQLTFKMRFWEEMHGEEERATYFFREYVNQAMRLEMKDAQTFQVEANQILSILYQEEGDERWREVLHNIKNVLAADSQYCFLTIAVSSTYEHSSQMTACYEEALTMVKHRPFDDETHILLESGGKEEPFLLPGSMEQELRANLQEGSDTQALHALRRIVANMKKKSCNTAQFHRFAEEIARKVMRVLHGLQLDTEVVSGMLGSIPHIHTTNEIEHFFETLIREAGRQVRLKKEESDPIVSFVMSYMMAHYAEDITLELVASKLSITGGYLSTYFKEKTGTNFVDFVNEFRIKQAMNLLLQQEMKIQDIAEAVGYQTMRSFNRTFKNLTGVTPSEYRRHQAVQE
ncbi:helix-turn-helix transcriptional regulator [Paenibacillus sp. GCM10027628]|uniref:helix-turn-helix transcriptional regulator n=1 Tax=Paenibacillus sp. GCM10027628 TaxID=3273413 RepID=UPI003645281B